MVSTDVMTRVSMQQKLDNQEFRTKNDREGYYNLLMSKS